MASTATKKIFWLWSMTRLADSSGNRRSSSERATVT